MNSTKINSLVSPNTKYPGEDLLEALLRPLVTKNNNQGQNKMENNSYINGIGQTINVGDWVVYPAGQHGGHQVLARVADIRMRRHYYNESEYRQVRVEYGWQSYDKTIFKKKKKTLTSTMRIVKVDINTVDFNAMDKWYCHDAKLLKMLDDLAVQS